MFDIAEDVILPVMLFAVPIVAIVGGISAGIAKTLSRHRLLEVALRERTALIARGVDPSRIPPVDAGLTASAMPWLADYPRLRAQGLLVGGFVTLAGGVSFGLVFALLDSWEAGTWGLGLVAASRRGGRG